MKVGHRRAAALPLSPRGEGIRCVCGVTFIPTLSGAIVPPEKLQPQLPGRVASLPKRSRGPRMSSLRIFMVKSIGYGKMYPRHTAKSTFKRSLRYGRGGGRQGRDRRAGYGGACCQGCEGRCQESRRLAFPIQPGRVCRPFVLPASSSGAGNVAVRWRFPRNGPPGVGLHRCVASPLCPWPGIYSIGLLGDAD